jgi:hypothetical protein
MCEVRLTDEVNDFFQNGKLTSVAKRSEIEGYARFKTADPTDTLKFYTIVVVEDITYHEAQLRATYCIDALWVPNDLKPNIIGNCGGGCKHSLPECGVDCFCDPFDGCE